KGDYRRMLLSRIKYSTIIRRKKYNNPQKAIIFWQNVENVIENNPKKYDIAISYAQGIPTYYVAEKVNAKKKIAWVNVSYHPDNRTRKYQSKYYNQFNKIVVVSDTTKEVFLRSFPEYINKTHILYDIN